MTSTHNDTPMYENSRSSGAAYPAAFDNCVAMPHLAPPERQRWMPTTDNPYPSTVAYAKSPRHQVNVTYGRPMHHGLSHSSGPFMYPAKVEYNRGPINSYERKHATIAYPTTHSIPGPALQSYIALPKKIYMY